MIEKNIPIELTQQHLLVEDLIKTQALLNLLVKKGVLTIEEIELEADEIKEKVSVVIGNIGIDDTMPSE